LRNFKAVKKAVKNQDIIVHIAGIIPPLSYEKPDYAYEINVEGTKKILEAMQKQDIPQKIIFTSSIAVYGDRLKNPEIKINDPVNPNDIYGETKLEAEEIVKESSLKYIIFRLSYCISIKNLEIKPIMFKVPLDTCLEIIDSRDVGLAITNAIKSDDLWNKTINLAGGKDCRTSYRDYLDRIFEIIGLGKYFLPDEAFAEEGFHCGFYETKEVQKELKFQRFNLKDFYKQIKNWIGIKKYFVSIFKWFIRKYLLRKSKYYNHSKT
jgi:nucleoside-diphosphate-sugar epimerase